MSTMTNNELVVLVNGYKISDDPEVVIVSKLGACVSVALFDPFAGLGGMNNFMLQGLASDPDTARAGVQIMEVLINELLKRGAQRERLTARVFGGATLMRDGVDLGRENVAFAETFVGAEKMPQAAGFTGGAKAIRVEFRPAFGKAKHILLPNETTAIFDAELLLRPEVVKDDSGDLELF